MRRRETLEIVESTPSSIHLNAVNEIHNTYAKNNGRRINIE